MLVRTGAPEEGALVVSIEVGAVAGLVPPATAELIRTPGRGTVVVGVVRTEHHPVVCQTGF